ncbi:aryl-alcohol-oxidase from pleurotus Eryingii [Amylostereum chailletii]|nr:aryl-alcohol-oxidase from pleurotus Eryingii [Amylostereum chailletii]
MSLVLLVVLLACMAFRVARAALYTSPAQLPVNRTYDYVIVGGGTGGSVVAARLSEDKSKNVLVIEAGGRAEDFPSIPIPYVCTTLSPRTLVDWNTTTVPQTGLNGRVINYPRGRVLGGSSSINYMLWSTGTKDDFNSFATITGDNGWSWKSVRPMIKSIEHLVPPADHHNTAGAVDPQIHGTRGPIPISLQGFPTLLDRRIIRTTQELCDEFPFNEDMNSGSPLGVGWTQYSIGNGTRASAATSYLLPALAAHENLDVLINTQATKLVQTGKEGRLPVFRGVELAQSFDGPRVIVKAKQEVVLAAGVVATPQLLMLSGIGNKTALQTLGIKPILNLPDVGQNLQDHVVLPNNFIINANFSQEDLIRNVTLQEEALAQWAQTRTGQAATPPGLHSAWLRLPKNASVFKSVQDPSPGPTSPHYGFIFAEAFSSFAEPVPPTGRFMVISTNLFQPTSRGTVTLNSTNPFATPLVDPQFLSTPFDIFTLREAVKAARRFASAPAWHGFIAGEYGEFAQARTDDEIEAYARKTAATVFDPVGTARMTGWKDNEGVVDPDMKVKGAKGLRVVDASVFPRVPSLHPQGYLYIFAERAAKLMKEDSM